MITCSQRFNNCRQKSGRSNRAFGSSWLRPWLCEISLLCC